MKKKDLTDLRNKKINELEKLLSKKRNELINTYAKIKAGKVKVDPPPAKTLTNPAMAPMANRIISFGIIIKRL